MAIRTVIDTNIFVSALSSKSQYHWLFELLLEEKLELFVTEEILLEYEEVLRLSIRTASHQIFSLLFGSYPMFFMRVYFFVGF